MLLYLHCKYKSWKVFTNSVGFLANDDPAAKQYAEWTERSCKQTGINFLLKHVKRTDLEENIIQANTDNSVHGIMVTLSQHSALSYPLYYILFILYLHLL